MHMKIIINTASEHELVKVEYILCSYNTMD